MNLLEALERLIVHKVIKLKSLLGLVKEEAKLAGLSIVPFLLILLSLSLVFTSAWLSLLILLGYGFYLLSNNYFLSILFVFLANVALLFILIKYCIYNLKNMSFEKTRKYFFGEDHADIQINSTRKHRKVRQEPKLPLSE